MDKEVKYRINEFDSFSKKFLENGYIIRPIANFDALDKIRDTVIQIATDILEIDLPKDKEFFLNSFHDLIDYKKLNDFRLSIYNKLNSFSWFKSLYYSLAETYIKSLVGNELVIQKRVNLSIQLPNDDSSILPVHADVWNGDSPYELVMWIPIVDCYASKSMFILPIEEENKISKSIKSFRTSSSDDLFNIIKGNIKWLDIKFGEVLLFSQNLMHGNIVNIENETRWSMNCRYKSLFSPYSAKKLGEFFEPLSIKPVTKLGMNYKFPKGF
ncbi:MAG: hypothetical protein CFH01_00653 [Alphaproteobacteria bacterium MarineAlpha2_Bin1]|nr:MAG: hypothetical protein CFH01_00653 [Alphaproteobacteria bacterium MarineAlpha2_Bin1]